LPAWRQRVAGVDEGLPARPRAPTGLPVHRAAYQPAAGAAPAGPARARLDAASGAVRVEAAAAAPAAAPGAGGARGALGATAARAGAAAALLLSLGLLAAPAATLGTLFHARHAAAPPRLSALRPVAWGECRGRRSPCLRAGGRAGACRGLHTPFKSSSLATL